MEYKCNNGTTWDMISFDAFDNEFLMDEIIKDNSYYYRDVVTFEGGEIIKINAQKAVKSSTIKTPWEE